MKKTLLLIALLLVQTFARAEWIEISTGDSIGDVSVYIDSAAVRRDGNAFFFWTLWDFAHIQADVPGVPYRSAKSQQEINCATKQARTLTLSYHSEQMALGQVVLSYSFDGSAGEFDRSWKPIMPNTFFSVIFESVCELAK
ncbi:MAG: hypothetical protein FIA96_05040 [Betaproteobacteria bacterium]|nr:hypothetical protein [Betaproteobacteria bacterium]